MKRLFFRYVVVLTVIALIVAAALLVRHRKAQLTALSPPFKRPIPVFTKYVEQGSLSVTRHYLGTIEPVASAVLSAQTTGYITAIYKDVGDILKKGEAVAEIDMRLYAARKNAIAAELIGAKEDLAIKETILDRRRKLIRDRSVSQEVLDQAELEASLSASRVQGLEQDLVAADVSLSFSHIDSFFDGIVTARMKDLGDLVTPNTPVLRVEAPDQGYKILIRVPQETAAGLPRKAPARLTHGNSTLKTVIDRVHPAIVSGNLATVEIRVPVRPFGLPSYGVVGADLTVAVLEGWMVPAECILETGAGAFVFGIADDLTVSPVSIRIMGRSGSRTIVAGSLTEGLSLAAGPESMLLTLGPAVRVLPVSGDPL